MKPTKLLNEFKNKFLSKESKSNGSQPNKSNEENQDSKKINNKKVKSLDNINKQLPSMQTQINKTECPKNSRSLFRSVFTSNTGAKKEKKAKNLGLIKDTGHKLSDNSSSVMSTSKSSAKTSSNTSELEKQNESDLITIVNNNNNNKAPIAKSQSNQKLIDLEFKNELERLFSNDLKSLTLSSSLSRTEKRNFIMDDCTSSTNQSPNLISTNNIDNNRAKSSDEKLLCFFRLIGGNLIKDYSDLLVDYDCKSVEIKRKKSKLLKNSLSDHGNSYNTSSSSDSIQESSLSSLLDENTSEFTSSLSKSSSSDTFAIFNFINNDFLFQQNNNNSHKQLALANFDHEKQVNLLIKLLVKSCRIFDVATIKNNEKIAYWRYANPIVAAFKRKNSSNFKLQNSSKIDKGVQTNQEEDLKEPGEIQGKKLIRLEYIIEKKIIKNSASMETSLARLKEQIKSELSIMSSRKDQTTETRMYDNAIALEMVSESFNLNISDDEDTKTSINNLKFNKSNDSNSIYVNCDSFENEIYIKNGSAQQLFASTNMKENNYKNKREKYVNFNELGHDDDDQDKKKENECEKLNESKLENEEKVIKNLEEDESSQNDLLNYNDEEEEEIEVEIGDDDDDDFNKENKEEEYDDLSEDDKKTRKIIKIDKNQKKNKFLVYDGQNYNNNNDKSNSSIGKKFFSNHKIINNNKYILFSRRKIQNNNNNNNRIQLNLNHHHHINNSRAQDETLRDADNISDIENEPYIDQWEEIINHRNDFEEEVEIKIKNDKTLSSSLVVRNNNNNSSSGSPKGTNLNFSNLNKNNKKINLKAPSFRINNNNNYKGGPSKSSNISNSHSTISISNNTNKNNLSSKRNKFLSKLNKNYAKQLDASKSLFKKNSIKSILDSLSKFTLVNNKSLVAMYDYETNNSNTSSVYKYYENSEKPPLSNTKLIYDKVSCNEHDDLMNRERTHSLDSLEEEYHVDNRFEVGAGQNSDFDVDLDINVSRIIEAKVAEMQSQELEQEQESELSEIPEIKIDFQYQLNSKRSINSDSDSQADNFNSEFEINNKIHFTNSTTKVIVESKNYEVVDLKDTTRFNEETVIKQRARESLKFWKQEEEKIIKHELNESSSHTTSHASISTANGITLTSPSYSSHNFSAKQNKTNGEKKSSCMDSGNSNDSTSYLSLNNNENGETSSAPLKCIKDRINAFESKSKEQTTHKPSFMITKRKEKSIVETQPQESVKTVPKNSIQSRIESLEKKADKAEHRRGNYKTRDSSLGSNDIKSESSSSLDQFKRGKSVTNDFYEDLNYMDDVFVKQNELVDESALNDQKSKIKFKSYAPAEYSMANETPLKMSSSKSLDNNLNGDSKSVQIPILLSNNKRSSENLTANEKKSKLNFSLENLNADAVLIPIKYNDEYLANNDSSTIRYTRKYSQELMDVPTMKNEEQQQQPQEDSAMKNKSESKMSVLTTEKSIHIERSDSRDDSDMEEVEIIIDLSTLNNNKSARPNSLYYDEAELNDEEYKLITECILNKSLDSMKTSSKSKKERNQKRLRAKNLSNDKLDSKSSKGILKKSDAELKLDEKIRSFVIHMLPVNRKAIVDDIVDGVKTLMSSAELEKIDSPVDLPERVTRFIQKRYSNLLNEPPLNSSDEIEGKLEQETEPFETTEVTVVKEIRKEMLSSNSESESFKDNSDILKVDEETLYIVEKRRQVDLKQTDVDQEIRKSFELKPKLTPSSSLSNMDKLATRNELNQLEYEYELLRINLIQLIDDLKKSIASFNNNLHAYKASSDINDYQLHFFNVDLDSNYMENKVVKFKDQQQPVLVMLFDKKNDENFKFGLEQSYHKSIVETHSLNNKQEINIIAKINLFYVDDVDSECEFKLNGSKFEKFSLIKTALLAEQINSDDTHEKLTNFLPIGKYFIHVSYKHLVLSNETDVNALSEPRTQKETIVDLSLLPLATRAQLVFEISDYLNKKINHRQMSSANGFETTRPKFVYQNLELPIVNMLAVDSFLVQLEINKNRDELIKDILIKNSDQFKLSQKTSTSGSSFTEIVELDRFMKTLELDLNSYYICEKVNNLNNDHIIEPTDDLVKLNKLDALASFKCVQKYNKFFNRILSPLSDDSSALNLIADEKQIGNKFYLIDNGNHYKCLVPVKDLAKKSIEEGSIYVDSLTDEASCANYKQLAAELEPKTDSVCQDTSDSTTITENLQHHGSVVIENINKRQNYIFSKHLMSAFPHEKGNGSLINLLANENNSIRSIRLKQEEQNDFIIEQHDSEVNDVDLPSFSESTSANDNSLNLNIVANASKQKFRIKIDCNKNKIIQEELKLDEAKCEQKNVELQDEYYNYYSTEPYQTIDEIAANYQKEKAKNQTFIVDNDVAKEIIENEIMKLKEMSKAKSNTQLNAESVQRESKQVRSLNDIEFSSFETDRLKLDYNLNEAANSKESRDKIIIKEIDRMFGTIRDHQSSNVKAKGEVNISKKKNKKNSGSWGYSSNKRHVRAKVMELPFAEDLNTLAKKVGINDISQIEQNVCLDDVGEKVFVRIDDYLSQEISHVLQRSYSVDYLNEGTEPRSRIKYVKILGQSTKSQSMLGCDYANIVPQTEIRSAPYDLRYWNILKLLEEERQTEDGKIISYFDDPYAKVESVDEWTKSNKLINGVLYKQNGNVQTTVPCTNSSINEDLKKFLSKNDLEEEIEQLKKEKQLKLLSAVSTNSVSNGQIRSTHPKSPKLIIKEKTAHSASNMYKKFDQVYKSSSQTKSNEALNNIKIIEKNTPKRFQIIDDIINNSIQTQQYSQDALNDYLKSIDQSYTSYCELEKRGDLNNSPYVIQKNGNNSTKLVLIENVEKEQTRNDFVYSKGSNQANHNTIITNLQSLIIPSSSMQFELNNEKAKRK